MQIDVDDFYQDSLVWDAHAGVFPSPEVNLNLLEEWPQNGVNYVSINVGFDVMSWQETLTTLAAYRKWVCNNSDRFKLVDNTHDIDQAKAEKKLALSFDIEGMNALNDNINMISLYHRLGVRQMLFAYNLNNTAAGGCHDRDCGLTEFGRQVVREMNNVGMIVDCSHAAYTTTMDIMAESNKPVVFSHSNPCAVWEHQRNIKDDQIKACSETGGVIGINGMGIFLGDNDSSNQALIRHICYIADLVGCEHIGFGFDYSPKVDIDIGVILRSRPDYWPRGQQYDTKNIQHASPQQFPELISKLFKAGFNHSDIRGMLGENFRRVATQVWDIKN